MSGQRSEPKISALLNNCGLHCTVPSVITTLRELGNLTEAAQNNFSHIANYRHLLATFQNYYRLAHLPTFKELHDYLSKYHSLEQQLIMGNVLRQLTFNHFGMRNIEPNYNTLTASVGYYPNTDDVHLETHICNALGISADIHAQAHEGSYLKIHSAKDDQNYKKINIYFKAGHYELSADPKPITEDPAARLYARYNSLIDAATSDPNPSFRVRNVENVLELLKNEVKNNFDKKLTPQRQEIRQPPPRFLTSEVIKGSILGAELGAVLGVGTGLYLALSSTITFASIGLSAIPPIFAIILITGLMSAIFSSIFTAAYKLSDKSDKSENSQYRI